MRRALLDARSARAVLLACLVGCGGPRKAAVYPVAGTLTVGGRPAANAMVAFHPLDPAGSRTALPVASTGPDGTYRLMTHAAGDGAPSGEYAVTVVWPDDSQARDECADDLTHDRFHGRYADPAKSPWRVIVGPGTNEVPLRAAAPAGDWSMPRPRETRESDRPTVLPGRPPRPPTALIAADDEGASRSNRSRAVRRPGGRPLAAPPRAKAAAPTRAEAPSSPAAAFLDGRMPVLGGATALPRPRERWPALPCCPMTAHGPGPVLNRFGATVAPSAEPFDPDPIRRAPEPPPGRPAAAGDDRRTRCA